MTDLDFPITTKQAPAKLNLFLHIVGRRADGYHLLESVFTLVDLCDTLHFQPNLSGLIYRSTEVENIPPSQDLIIRAATALRARALADGIANAAERGANIGIEKQIPTGAGLGGGSSDAATTLKTLNTLWDFNYPDQILSEIGLKLGADVPFFIFGQDAFVQGIGEQLRAAELPKFAYLIVKPDVHVATPAIFAAPELTRSTKTLTILDFSRETGFVSTSSENAAVLRFTAANLASFSNDMQAVVVKHYSAVASVLKLLQLVSSENEVKLAPRMTGSGACIFAAFANVETALLAQQSWQQKVSALSDSTSSLQRAKTFVVKSLFCNT